MSSGNLYKNNKIYHKDCLHILEVASKNNISDGFSFIYKNNTVEYYNHNACKNNILHYEKVLFGYNYLVTFKENLVTTHTTILIDYDKNLLETTKLQFFNVNDCNIILIPANKTNKDDIIADEECVEFLELCKNNESILLDIPYINLEVNI